MNDSDVFIENKKDIEVSWGPLIPPSSPWDPVNTPDAN